MRRTMGDKDAICRKNSYLPAMAARPTEPRFLAAWHNEIDNETARMDAHKVSWGRTMKLQPPTSEVSQWQLNR